jgi:Ca-activated chloride channel family protein
MKLSYSVVLFLSFLFISQSFAQKQFEYAIEVIDTRGVPKSNLEIVLIESSTFKRLQYVTDRSGRAVFTITDGDEWVMHVGEMKAYSKLNTSYQTGSGSALVTYDLAKWQRLNLPPVDRSKIILKKNAQVGVRAGQTPQRGHSIVEIELKNGKGQVWRNVEVSMVCYENLTSYDSKTDGYGVARFYIPNNYNYQIDLDGDVDYSFCDLGNRSMVKTIRFLYEKIDFTEVENTEGYIEQTFIKPPTPISNRYKVTLNVIGGPNNGKNEEVYLDMAYSNKMYYGKTDDDGNVTFMLPKKRKYALHFNYQKFAGQIDLSNARGIGQMTESYRYIPEERLLNPEKFLPSSGSVKQYDINAFNKKSIAPVTSDNLINIQAIWGGEKINSDSKEALMELVFSINKEKLKETVTKPLNISFVLDRSGSMSGENMDILKKSMLSFIDKLRPTDMVSLVFFNEGQVIAYPQDSVHKNELKDIVYALEAGGGTNIYDGLKMGYEQLSKTFNPKATNRVILLTDGYGSKPIDFILKQSESYFSKGISVSTIGVGYHYNNSLLSLLSKYSGGFEHSVIESSGIDKALTAEFESLFTPTASDLKVVINYNNKIIFKTIYGIPEKKNTNHMVSFELSEVFSTLNKMALVKFKLENPDKTIENKAITIDVSYFDEYLQKDVKVVKEMFLEWTEESTIEMIYDDNLKQVYSVAVINQAMKAIADLCDAKDYKGAKRNIEKTLKSLKKINDENYKTELIPLINQLKDYMESLDLMLLKIEIEK